MISGKIGDYHVGHQPSSRTRRQCAATSAQATLHCLTGCVIGEVAGLMIGVTPRPAALADDRSGDRAGLSLGHDPGPAAGDAGPARRHARGASDHLDRRGDLDRRDGVVMNFVDYQMGGMTAPSVCELDVLARHRLRGPGRLPRRLAGQLLAAQARAQGVPLSVRLPVARRDLMSARCMSLIAQAAGALALCC